MSTELRKLINKRVRPLLKQQRANFQTAPKDLMYFRKKILAVTALNVFLLSCHDKLKYKISLIPQLDRFSV